MQHQYVIIIIQQLLKKHLHLGDVAISGGITINVNSTLRLSDPLFTLTCISIGGPATNVIWTKDSVIVTEGTKSVLDDPVTARYTHTLTGNTRGEYTCTVTNAKPSNDSATIILQGNRLCYDLDIYHA